jgi:predicted enzyme involved in methoxymalonyl-ACP biosynthesis
MGQSPSIEGQKYNNCIKILFIIIFIDVFGKCLNLPGYGSCFYLANKDDKDFAVKILDLEKIGKNPKIQEVIESAIKCKSPYLARYKETFENDDLKKFIVIEYLKFNFHSLIEAAKKSGKKFTEEVCTLNLVIFIYLYSKY